MPLSFMIAFGIALEHVYIFLLGYKVNINNKQNKAIQKTKQTVPYLMQATCKNDLTIANAPNLS